MRLRRRDVEPYLSTIARRLRLGHFDVIYDPGEPPSDPDAAADITVKESCHATVRLCVGFERFPLRDQREYLTHEICHLHTERFALVSAGLETVLSAKAFAIAETVLMDAEECAVQSFARLLAPRLPLPPRWTTTRPRARSRSKRAQP